MRSLQHVARGRMQPGNTPPAGTVAYGHGAFTTGTVDFRQAFQTLMPIEHRCRDDYCRRFAQFTDER